MMERSSLILAFHEPFKRLVGAIINIKPYAGFWLRVRGELMSMHYFFTVPTKILTTGGVRMVVL